MLAPVNRKKQGLVAIAGFDLVPLPDRVVADALAAGQVVGVLGDLGTSSTMP